MLGKLSMPEDVAIRGKRLTGLRLTDQHILKTARQNSDDFIYDPEERAREADRKRRVRDLFWVRNQRAKKGRAKNALGADLAPATPSPRLNVPKTRAPVTPR